MRGLNSGRPLCATSSSLFILIFVFLISASSLASTRSVEISRDQHNHHRKIRESNHVINGEKLNFKSQQVSALTILGKNENAEQGDFSALKQGSTVRDNIEKSDIDHEDKFTLKQIDNRHEKVKDEIDGSGKAPINSASPSSKINGASLNSDQEGIRRFDAIVVNEEIVEKISGNREKQKSKNRMIENSEIDKTVTKGIIVRDEPVEADGIEGEKFHISDENSSKFKHHRKRSLNNSQLIHADAPVLRNENSANEHHETLLGSAREKNVESAKASQVPVHITAGASHAKSSPRLSSKHVAGSPSQFDEKMHENVSKHANEQDGHVDKSSELETSRSEAVKQIGSITKSVEAQVKSIDKLIEHNDSQATEDIVVPEIKKIIIHEDSLSEVKKSPEEQNSNARTVGLIGKDENDQEGYVETERSEDKSRVRESNQNSFNSSSLSYLFKTDVSLEELKAQAMSLQGSIKNKTFLQRLRDERVEILPQIPEFTEVQLFDALKTISLAKKIDDISKYSYLSKHNTSVLSESQLKIVRCTEALVVREQRQTFVENMFECIRGLSILNCMRIFVWPVIADNIPESLSQNLPTLPIEVNVADWLSGNPKEIPKSSSLRSTTDFHQQRLITPELVVSNILKDALSVNPNNGANLPTFIDPKNETLSKLLTTGQLEILRMAEKFLPESSRREYSERMYSCVQRFEYFSCVKYFTWPMVKQHFAALPQFPDYQSWYPNVSLYPGYPILPYPNAEGVGELPEVVEADATRTKGQSPEAVIIQILENTLRQSPRISNSPTIYYSAEQPATLLPPISTDQMAIFYTAEQLIPPPMRSEFISKTMKCIRNYDYLTCTKYSTWPTIRQLYPGLPQFPDFSSWIPTFAVPQLPDFSEYISNFSSYFPTFPGFPSGGSWGQKPQPQPQPITDKPPSQAQPEPHPQPQPQPQPQPPQPQQPQPQPPQLQPQPQPPQAQQPQPQPPQLQPQPPQPQPQPPQLQPPQPQPQQPQPSIDKPPYQPQPHPQPQLETQVQLNPDRPSYLPHPQTIPDRPPYQLTESSSADPSNLSEEDHRLSESIPNIENRIIQILSNIRWTVQTRNSQQSSPVTQGTLAVLSTLTHNQLKICGLSKSVIPAQVHGDLDARLVGCLQGGSNFLSCTRNIIWPTLQLYVKNMPIFPQEEDTKISELIDSPMELYPADPKVAGLSERYVITPGIYQPIVHAPVEIAGRSPLGSHIIAESEEELPNLNAQTQSGFGILSIVPESHSSDGQSRQEVTETSGDPLTPVISITDTSFTPIFSDRPETVLLKILKTVRSSSKFSDNSQTLESSAGYLESLNDYLSPDQKSVIQISENLLPVGVRSNFMQKISGCAKNSNFVACSRDIVWPTLLQYYPRLPNFPNFNFNDDSMKKIEVVTSGSKNSNIPGAGVVTSAISETDVKTGQHGDAMVTITDTRFVPIFSEHPEELILGILRNLQISLPSLAVQQDAITKSSGKSSEFVATFTDQQGNIITVAESLLPESIRQVFNKRMTECVKENEFLDCTRDIAWPTIAQFFPRLQNFPNIGALSGLTIDNKPAQQLTLLPPHLDPAGMLGVNIPTKPTLGLPTENLIPVTPEDEVESRIESILKHTTLTTEAALQSKRTYLSTKDLLKGSFLTERQGSVIRMCEDLLPNSIKTIFIGNMVECSRADVFSNCIRNVGWPMLRQYVPNIPEFPDFGNLGTYFPQVSQEIPQTPQFPDYQLPVQVPNFPAFGLPGQGYVYPFRAAEDRVSHEEVAYVPQGSLIAGGEPSGFSAHLSGIQGLTPSVDSSTYASSRIWTGSSGYSSLVPAEYPSGASTDLLTNDKSKKIIIKSSVSRMKERRRTRRSLGTEVPYKYKDISSNDIDPLPFKMTDSYFLEILVNITKQQSDEKTRNPGHYFVESLNTTIKEALTADQYRILKIVEDINFRTVNASFMSKVVQCIRSLSFIRCMGIFVWPLVTQNFPSLPGLPTLGSLSSFGRSEQTSNFQDIFGMTSGEFERELLVRKEHVEEILVEWYRGLVEEKFDKDYGFMRVHGYGDGEIGINFNSFGRTGRGAKIKDHKNLPSILTIISDIMEDVLDQREPKPEYERKKEHGKRDNFRRDKSFRERIDDYNEVSIENARQESSNDDKIIAMFLAKIRSNGTLENGDASEANNYLSVEDAYEAFELLFGTRLSERMAERLNILSEEDSSSIHREGNSREFSKETDDDNRDKRIDEKRNKNIRSNLVLRLPRIDEDFISRKMTSGLMDLGRKMKIQMSQIMPGISFVVSFFIQMALAHARAAASIAGMMSNMALGSAMLSMIRHSLFGPMTHPKIKYVYDNVAMGPGITWPQHNHH